MARLQSDAQWWHRLTDAPWEAFLKSWDQQTVFSPSPVPVERSFHPTMTRCFDEWSLGRQACLLEKLATISCPVQWIYGEHDAKFGALGRQAVSQLPGGQLIVAPQVGHRVPWEWPNFTATIRDFVGSK